MSFVAKIIESLKMLNFTTMGCHKLTYWSENTALEKNKTPLKSGIDYYPFGLSFNQQTRENTHPQNYQYNGKELQTDLDLNWMDYGARMYDASIGRWHVVDALSMIQENFSPYHYVYNNPINFNDPSGLIGEDANDRIESTFIGPDGSIIDHRDDGDNRIYYVNDPEAWKKNGKKKKGLSTIGFENPSFDYQIGHKIDLLSRNQNLIAPASGAIEIDNTIESFVIPFARPLGWGLKLFGKFAMKLVNRGGKWVWEVVETGTNKVVARFAAKATNKLTVQFGKGANQFSHVFRHTDVLGLNRELVKSAVEAHFKGVSSKLIAGKPFNQVIEIAGKRIQYTAFKLKDGTINIGRIHGVLK